MDWKGSYIPYIFISGNRSSVVAFFECINWWTQKWEKVGKRREQLGHGRHTWELYATSFQKKYITSVMREETNQVRSSGIQSSVLGLYRVKGSEVSAKRSRFRCVWAMSTYILAAIGSCPWLTEVQLLLSMVGWSLVAAAISFFSIVLMFSHFSMLPLFPICSLCLISNWVCSQQFSILVVLCCCFAFEMCAPTDRTHLSRKINITWNNDICFHMVLFFS